jgi:hypothetical protein
MWVDLLFCIFVSPKRVQNLFDAVLIAVMGPDENPDLYVLEIANESKIGVREPKLENLYVDHDICSGVSVNLGHSGESEFPEFPAFRQEGQRETKRTGACEMGRDIHTRLFRWPIQAQFRGDELDHKPLSSGNRIDSVRIKVWLSVENVYIRRAKNRGGRFSQNVPHRYRRQFAVGDDDDRRAFVSVF